MITPELIEVCRGTVSNQIVTMVAIIVAAALIGFIIGVLFHPKGRLNEFERAKLKREQAKNRVAAMFMSEGLSPCDSLYESERMLSNQGRQFLEHYNQ